MWQTKKNFGPISVFSRDRSGATNVLNKLSFKHFSVTAHFAVLFFDM